MESVAINQSSLQVWLGGWPAGLSPWPMHSTSSADRSKRPVLSGNLCFVWAKLVDVIRDPATEGHRRAQFLPWDEFDVWSQSFWAECCTHTQILYLPHCCAVCSAHECKCVHHNFSVNTFPHLLHDAAQGALLCFLVNKQHYVYIQCHAPKPNVCIPEV